MAYFKSFLSLWYSIKKIPRLLAGAPGNPLANATALPWIIDFVKSFSEDYRRNKRNSWDYLLAHFPCEGLSNEKEKRRYLIEQLNASLLAHSPEKENPWVVNDRNEDFIEIKKQCCLKFDKQVQQAIDTDPAFCSLIKSQKHHSKKYVDTLATLAHFTYKRELQNRKSITLTHLSEEESLANFKTLLKKKYTTIEKKLKRFKQLQKIVNTKPPSIHFSKLSESVAIQLPPSSFWEQSEPFTHENPISQFFEIVWNSVSSPSNLLKWISFGFIVFAISFHFFPYIVLGIGGLAIGYFLLQCVLALTSGPEPISLNLLTQEEEENLIQTIKQEVFNKERYKQELAIIQKQLRNSTIDLTKVTEHFFACKKIDLIQFSKKLQLQNSSLYQQLSQVNPKTQFIASLVVKLTSTILYGYLASWATSTLLAALGAPVVASFLASPVGVGLLILIPAVYFLIQHLRQARSKEDFYQKKIYSLLNAQCEYSFTDAEGKPQRMKLEKWKKFECLREEIRLLEIKITKLLEEKKLTPDSAVYTLFIDHINNSHRLYHPNDRDKTQRENLPFFTKVKKTLNRSFAFLAGGSYGYGLGQQIVVESSLGMKTVLKIVLLPVLLPLIILNAIANLVTYHLNAKQRDKVFFATHLDNKLQNLEYTRKKLLYLGATLSALDPPLTRDKLETTKPTETQSKQVFIKPTSNSPLIPTKFFHSTPSLHSPITADTQENTHTKSATNLTH